MRQRLLIGLLLAGITLAIYWPVGNYDLVYFDDPAFIKDNSEIQSGLSWHTIAWTMTSVVVANWHPVTSLSFVLGHQFWGFNPGAEHLVNVAFHIVNALLLLLVLSRTTGALWRSAVVAALFAWHPLRVESVAWISERKDVLSGFFTLLCLWAYVRFVEAKQKKPESKTARRTWFTTALLMLSFGLMSKAMAVTVPFLLLLLDIWPLNRVSSFKFWDRSSRAPALQSLTLGRLLLEKWPFFSLSAIFCVITVVVQKNYAAMTPLEQLGWEARIDNTIVSYLRYLAKMIWPVDLAIIYPHPASRFLVSGQWPEWQIWAAAALLVAVSTLCLRLISCKPCLAFGWFWYLGTMLPVIGLIQVGEQALADRYTYIPLIGPAISLIWLIPETWISGFFRRASLALLVIAPLTLCGLLTRHQLYYWENTVRLFGRSVDVTGPNPSAESGLALGLEHEGHTSQAMVYYRIAMRLNPTGKEALYGMGRLLMKQEKWPEAIETYSAVVAFDPNDLISHLGLASCLPHLGRTREAAKNLETAVLIAPDFTEALNNLAWILATSADSDLRDGKRAVQLAERACELTKYKQTIMVGTLAAAYAEAGQFDDAIATAQKACSLAFELGEKELLQKNQRLLALYQVRQPFHDISTPNQPEPSAVP